MRYWDRQAPSASFKVTDSQQKSTLRYFKVDYYRPSVLSTSPSQGRLKTKLLPYTSSTQSNKVAVASIKLSRFHTSPS